MSDEKEIQRTGDFNSLKNLPEIEVGNTKFRIPILREKVPNENSKALLALVQHLNNAKNPLCQDRCRVN